MQHLRTPRSADHDIDQRRVNSTRKTYPIAMTIAPEANVAFAPHRLVTFDDTGANPIIRTPPGIIANPASAAESPRPSADATGN